MIKDNQTKRRNSSQIRNPIIRKQKKERRRGNLQERRPRRDRIEQRAYERFGPAKPPNYSPPATNPTPPSPPPSAHPSDPHRNLIPTIEICGY